MLILILGVRVELGLDGVRGPLRFVLVDVPLEVTRPGQHFSIYLII